MLRSTKGLLGSVSRFLSTPARLSTPFHSSTTLPISISTSLSSSAWTSNAFRTFSTESSIPMPDFNKNHFLLNETLRHYLSQHGKKIKTPLALQNLISSIWATAYTFSDRRGQTLLANENIKLVLQSLDKETVKAICEKASDYISLVQIIQSPEVIEELNTTLGSNHINNIIKDSADLLKCPPSLLGYMTGENLRAMVKDLAKLHELMKWCEGSYKEGNSLQEKPYLQFFLSLLGDDHVMKQYSNFAKLADDLTSSTIDGKVLKTFLKDKLSGIALVTAEEIQYSHIPFRIGGKS